jgi:asparagine synthase (glutamine-hydrolysing)
MCGITGYIFNNDSLQDTSVILKMLKVQKHRGPDDAGIRAFNLELGQSVELPTAEPVAIESKFNAILGFNRLSILDLSANGHQPMTSPDQKVLLTLNGEIYNAFDFKDELIQWGHHFKSTSDTEVVLALYLKYGIEGLLKRLNGMFAIVIADLGKNKLYIARDRFGIKPMYYISNEKLFAFSSELKSFAFLPDFSFQLADDKLDEYLLFRNNLKDTLFKDIQVLEPGHCLVLTPGNNPVKSAFFQIRNYIRNNNVTGSLDTCEKMLEIYLGKSIQRQLMSDVKLGCQLSGGVDSSLVTYFANRNGNQGNFESVSIVFSDPAFSEEQYIDQVSTHLNIPSHKFLLESSYYLEHIEKVTWHLEYPINHPNTMGIYLLSQRAREYVTVLLSGEGADEVFGGYRRYYDVNFPFQNRIFLSKVKNSYQYPMELISYLNPAYRAVTATAYMPTAIAGKMKKDFSFKKAINERIHLYNSLQGSVFDRQVKYEMMTYLPDLLIRQDKMSMAHSIENRVPFLDNELVNKAFNIPEKYLLVRKSAEGFNTEKYMLKNMAARVFDRDFAFRTKMGFGIPIKKYFLDKEFLAYLNDQVLPGIRKRGIFNHRMVSKWLDGLNSIDHHELESLWIVLAFEIWASIYLDHSYENWHTSF